VSVHIKTRDEAVKAIVGVFLDKLKDAVAHIDLDPQSFYDFFQSVRTESDRAMAIIIFSFIEERLGGLLREAMSPDIVGGPATLFEGFGPLSTASARIELAAALYWLSPETYHNLRLLRKIRNGFAHGPFVGNFEEAKIRDLLNAMDPLEDRVFEAFSIDKVNLDRAGTSQRIAFLLRSILTCSRMMAEVSTAPCAQRVGLPPHVALGVDARARPEAIDALWRITSELVVDLLSEEGVLELDDDASSDTDSGRTIEIDSRRD